MKGRCNVSKEVFPTHLLVVVETIVMLFVVSEKKGMFPHSLSFHACMYQMLHIPILPSYFGHPNLGLGFVGLHNPKYNG
jgi:hypothetical protein